MNQILDNNIIKDIAEPLDTVKGLIKYKSKYYKKVGIHSVVDTPIIIIEFDLRKSRTNPRKTFIIVKFLNLKTGRKEFFWGDKFYAIEYVLRQFDKANFIPKSTIIRYNNFYYFNNLIK